jgi:hypothetical protein
VITPLTEQFVHILLTWTRICTAIHLKDVTAFMKIQNLSVYCKDPINTLQEWELQENSQLT